MFRRFIIPVFISFISVYVLGWFISELVFSMRWLVPSPTSENAVAAIVLQFLIPYVMVVVSSLLFFRQDRLRLAAVIAGPILVILLLILGAMLWVILSGGNFSL